MSRLALLLSKHVSAHSQNLTIGGGARFDIRGPRLATDIKPETSSVATLDTGDTANMCSGHLSVMTVF